MALQSMNPVMGAALRVYEEHDEDAVEHILETAQGAFERGRSASWAVRTGGLRRVADLLEARAHECARIMTEEMGKPIGQAVVEAKKCAWACRYYAAQGEAFLRDEPVEIGGSRAFVAYEPLGVVLAVMPWNYPFWQVFRFAAPALMAGNAVLLKHAPNVTGCALAIEALLAEAGFDEHVFQVLRIGEEGVAGVLADPRVRAATLTGSGRAGRAIGALAGGAIKPSVLELGGSDPFIVLADADLERAVELGVRSRMQNNGQSCIAAKRFVVEEPVLDAFTERFVERVDALRVGDPMDEATDVGPLARHDLREHLRDQVERTIEEGARLRTGGGVPVHPGCFYEPTVLVDVEAGSVPFREELFGPVASIVCARDAEHAVALANDTPFGLGAAVFTGDPDRGERIARRLQVGCAFVNDMVKSDPRLPFGGIKASGYGRELSQVGIRAFVNVKTVWMDRAGFGEVMFGAGGGGA